MTPLQALSSGRLLPPWPDASLKNTFLLCVHFMSFPQAGPSPPSTRAEPPYPETLPPHAESWHSKFRIRFPDGSRCSLIPEVQPPPRYVPLPSSIQKPAPLPTRGILTLLGGEYSVPRSSGGSALDWRRSFRAWTSGTALRELLRALGHPRTWRPRVPQAAGARWDHAKSQEPEGRPSLPTPNPRGVWVRAESGGESPREARTPSPAPCICFRPGRWAVRVGVERGTGPQACVRGHETPPSNVASLSLSGARVTSASDRSPRFRLPGPLGGLAIRQT